VGASASPVAGYAAPARTGFRAVAPPVGAYGNFARFFKGSGKGQASISTAAQYARPIYQALKARIQAGDQKALADFRAVLACTEASKAAAAQGRSIGPQECVADPALFGRLEQYRAEGNVIVASLPPRSPTASRTYCRAIADRDTCINADNNPYCNWNAARGCWGNAGAGERLGRGAPRRRGQSVCRQPNVRNNRDACIANAACGWGADRQQCWGRPGAVRPSSPKSNVVLTPAQQALFAAPRVPRPTPLRAIAAPGAAAYGYDYNNGNGNNDDFY